MDLLTVLMHEVGHLLGRGHETDGLMAETLAAGTRRTPESGPNSHSGPLAIDCWSWSGLK